MNWDSMKGFLTLLFLTVVSGILYMFGVQKLANWVIGKRRT